MTSGEKKTLECRDINRGSFEWETQKEREGEEGREREEETGELKVEKIEKISHSAGRLLR